MISGGYVSEWIWSCFSLQYRTIHLRWKMMKGVFHALPKASLISVVWDLLKWIINYLVLSYNHSGWICPAEICKVNILIKRWSKYSTFLLCIPNSIYDSAANWNKIPGHGDITKEREDQYGDDHNSAHDPVNSGQEAANYNPRHVAPRMCLVS